jgi:hypothetical protein
VYPCLLQTVYVRGPSQSLVRSHLISSSSLTGYHWPRHQMRVRRRSIRYTLITKCDTCRTRKSKCGNVDPHTDRCGTCEKFSSLCTWEGRDKSNRARLNRKTGLKDNLQRTEGCSKSRPTSSRSNMGPFALTSADSQQDAETSRSDLSVTCSNVSLPTQEPVSHLRREKRNLLMSDVVSGMQPLEKTASLTSGVAELDTVRQPGSDTSTEQRKHDRRYRLITKCDPCRTRKFKCSGSDSQSGHCQNCRELRLECTWEDKKTSINAQNEWQSTGRGKKRAKRGLPVPDRPPSE